MSKKDAETKVGFRVLEEARDAVVKLRTLKPFLSDADKETLNILMDEELMGDIERSLRDEEEGKVEPLESIVD